MKAGTSQGYGSVKSFNRLFTVLILITACIFAFLIWNGSSSGPTFLSRSNPNHLRLTQSSTFKISIFSDLHFGEDEDSFGIEQDIKSEALMHRVLDLERPDFVVLNGDLITGENTFAHNSSQYVDRIVGPLVDGKYSWASTYGNHDSKFNLSRDSILAAESKYKNSFTQRGPVGTDGVTNYVLPVYHSSATASGYACSWLLSVLDAQPEKPAALLWFFDSRGGASYQHDPPNVDDIPNHVSESTVNWFRETERSLKNLHGPLPSLAFVHIPMHAFLELQSQHDPTVHSSVYPGMNDDVPLAQQGYSDTGTESIPFMRALLETEGLHSVYSAHDHGDSWCGRWPDSDSSDFEGGRPFLCFCKHSGFGGYGTWNRGVRHVQLTFGKDQEEEMSVNTWVRMEDGSIVTAVSLNFTYGTDSYDIADGGYHPPKNTTTAI